MSMNKLFVISWVIVMMPQVFCTAFFPSELNLGDKVVKDPKYDFVFKKILGNENILLAFINSALNRSSAENPKFTHVQYLGNSLDPATLTSKQTYLDVICRTDSGDEAIVEVQREKQPNFNKRAVYYSSSLYIKQLESPSAMRKLKEKKNEQGDEISTPLPQSTKQDEVYKQPTPVHFIGICDFTLFPKKDHYISTHLILDKDDENHDIQEFSWTFIELDKMKRKKLTDVNKLKTDVEKFSFLFLFDKESEQYKTGLQTLAKSDNHIENALNLANSVTWTDDEQLLFEADVRRTNDIAAKIEAGFEDGKKAGIEESKKEIAVKLLKDGTLSDEKISEISGLDKGTILKLRQSKSKNTT